MKKYKKTNIGDTSSNTRYLWIPNKYCKDPVKDVLALFKSFIQKENK